MAARVIFGEVRPTPNMIDDIEDLHVIFVPIDGTGFCKPIAFRPNAVHNFSPPVPDVHGSYSPVKLIVDTEATGYIKVRGLNWAEMTFEEAINNEEEYATYTPGGHSTYI